MWKQLSKLRYPPHDPLKNYTIGLKMKCLKMTLVNIMSLDPVEKKTKLATAEIKPQGEEMLLEETTRVIPTPLVVVPIPLPLSLMLASSLGNANRDGRMLGREDMMSALKLWLTLFESQRNPNLGRRNLRSLRLRDLQEILLIYSALFRTQK